MYHQAPITNAGLLSEVRLQETRFGLSPLDRSRLQWEIVEEKKLAPAPQKKRTTSDPRKILKALK